ncbi:alpha-1,2-mannosyltransferase ALG9 [Dermacentor andersoni]|uniref:alpha-1,2-mannosyltransferase ALG9 n=1 Tax=Dermacentor andersoni TaxID=34620 RepID=UPI003B3BE0DA
MARQRRKEPRDHPRKLQLAAKPRPPANANDDQLGPWAPLPYTAFKAILSARLCAAVWNNIADCDETFNYWEPTHYLMYGKGLQTWEYSPQYAIRSYAYLWLHALPGLVYSNLLQSNRVLVFYFMRCILGFVCALCEVYFYKGVLKRFGPVVARSTLVLLLFSTGMFISCTAYLPSAFSMYCAMVACGGWFLGDYRVTVFATAVGALLGWPFSAALSLPAAYDIACVKRKLHPFLVSCVGSLAFILPVLVAIDSHYFGRTVLAPLNIVIYNVFSKHGANLYGVEPWSFYFKNGLLNFNVAFAAALASGPVVLMWPKLTRQGHAPQGRVSSDCLLELAPLYLWCAIFFSQAHKEERFLFPVYPLICLCAAICVNTLESVTSLYSRTLTGVARRATSALAQHLWLVFLVTATLLSVSRTVALYRNFRAPMEIYMELGPLASLGADSHGSQGDIVPSTLCVGKEWYRFPSSFFLPQNWELSFIESEFRGQLPKPYASGANGTRIIPTDMNDANREEQSRYVNPTVCDYLVDTDGHDVTDREPDYSSSPDWEVITSVKFLDSKRSPVYARTFYVPFVTEQQCVYVNYYLLKRKKPTRNKA